MKIQLTAIFKAVPEGYIGFVEELPGGKHTRRDTRRGPSQSGRSCRVGFGGQPAYG